MYIGRICLFKDGVLYTWITYMVVKRTYHICCLAHTHFLWLTIIMEMQGSTDKEARESWKKVSLSPNTFIEAYFHYGSNTFSHEIWLKGDALVIEVGLLDYSLWRILFRDHLYTGVVIYYNAVIQCLHIIINTHAYYYPKCFLRKLYCTCMPLKTIPYGICFIYWVTVSTVVCIVADTDIHYIVSC